MKNKKKVTKRKRVNGRLYVRVRISDTTTAMYSVSSAKCKLKLIYGIIIDKGNTKNIDLSYAEKLLNGKVWFWTTVGRIGAIMKENLRLEALYKS